MTIVLFFDFFFFKQKTAYEMRISDWSSDVCSSDLRINASIRVFDKLSPYSARTAAGKVAQNAEHQFRHRRRRHRHADHRRSRPVHERHRPGFHGRSGRSEEHTSELQSLMRISYAVFCLKKKNNNTKIQNILYQRTTINMSTNLNNVRQQQPIIDY